VPNKPLAAPSWRDDPGTCGSPCRSPALPCSRSPRSSPLPPPPTSRHLPGRRHPGDAADGAAAWPANRPRTLDRQHRRPRRAATRHRAAPHEPDGRQRPAHPPAPRPRRRVAPSEQRQPSRTSGQTACLLRWPSRWTLALGAASWMVGPVTSGFGFVLCPAGCTTTEAPATLGTPLLTSLDRPSSMSWCSSGERRCATCWAMNASNCGP